LTGTFHAVLDQLIASNLKIVGEVSRVHEFCLCAPEKSNLNEIKRVLSHPTVLEHCANYISQLEQKQTERKKPFQIDRQATWDSAGACQIVKNEGKINVAAIASEQAACNHGLKVSKLGKLHGMGLIVD
jgi:prephenate dehydratase